MKEFQTSLTFAHEVSHNLGADHDVDRNGYAVNGTLMGATLGNHVKISNLKISPKTKEAIGKFLTEVGKGISYDHAKTMHNNTHFYSHKWPKEDQNRVKKGYGKINCFKTKLEYSNDKKHFLKLRKNLENQVNSKILTNESTTGLTSIESGSINFNLPNVKYLSLFSQFFQIFCCICMLNF